MIACESTSGRQQGADAIIDAEKIQTGAHNKVPQVNEEISERL
jgi:hypothetical protein